MGGTELQAALQRGAPVFFNAISSWEPRVSEVALGVANLVQVLDPAVPPELKARPQRILIVFIAGVLSLFASICYTLGSVYVRAIRTRWTAEHGAG